MRADVRFSGGKTVYEVIYQIGDTSVMESCSLKELEEDASNFLSEVLWPVPNEDMVGKLISLGIISDEMVREYIEQKEEDLEEDVPVGTIVKVVGNSVDHRFPIGEIVVRKDAGDQGRFEYLDGRDYWYMDRPDYEIIRKAG